MQTLNSLKYKKGTTAQKKRVGRGMSAGQGKTCGRGHKGQNSRTGGGCRPGFEGGQNPIYRRLPKEKGFKNLLFKQVFAAVNLTDLNDFSGPEVKIQDLIAKNIIKANENVKILGGGEIKKALTIEAHAFSKSAKEKIEKAGGKTQLCKVS